MKKIFIIRHAKSSWDNPMLRDFDRPLNERGLRDAPFMAQRLADRKIPVDFLIHSSAKRTTQTADYFIKTHRLDSAFVQSTREIYEASLENLLETLEHIPTSVCNAVLIGHNPGLSILINYLTREVYDMPTCAIAEIDLYVEDWNQIARECGQLVSFDYPKKHTH